MFDFVIGVLAFIGLGTIVFIGIMWLCAYWATSSHIIGGIVVKDKKKDVV